MKESKTLIIGLVVFIFLVLVVSGFFFSGREVLFAEEEVNAAIEFIEMDEPLIVISPEHEYPLTANIIGDDGVEREVTFEIIDGEIVCSTTAREAVEILYLCLCQSSIWEESIDYGKDLPFRFAEPNEPEEQYLHIWEPKEQDIITLDFIPTWPDYIELEKELRIDFPDNDKPMSFVGWWFPKGTKIYFKE